jgi:hypothetical protein
MWNLDPYFSSLFPCLGEVDGERSEYNDVRKTFVKIGAEKAALSHGQTLMSMIMRMIRKP